MQKGRKQIFTDVEEITRENVIRVLRQAMLDFLPNASDCTELLNYEKGIQPKIREKKYRSEIDIWCTDNIANEITDFKVSFNWGGNSISLVQRGEKDGGASKESDAISLLNECYEAENIKQKTQELARFVEICGIGYTLVDINTEYEDGDSYFKINVLDPRFAFVVRSSRYADRRIMLGVTFRKDKKGNTYFTCFTKRDRFEILNLVKIINKKTKRDKKTDKWEHLERSGEENPLGRVPITEWIRNYDRMGCFERQIDEMNNLNLLVSDFSNSVEQTVQCLWQYTDIEFPTDEDGNEVLPKSNDIVRVFTTKDGKTPSIKPLILEQDYQGMINQMVYRVSRIKEKCNVPQRDSSGNNTGVATSFAGGYQGAEDEAEMQDQIKYGCKIEEVKSVLAAIRECPDIPADSPLLKLRYCDIQAQISRQRSYELSVKTTALANMLSHGIYGLHAFKTVNLFDDISQVWTDSKDLIEKYQKSLFEKNDSTDEKEKAQTSDGGMEAQISNSPLIDGMSREKPKETGEEN